VEPTQADAHIMGVARQASAAATGRLMCELKAYGHHEGEDTLEALSLLHLLRDTAGGAERKVRLHFLSS